MTDSIAPEGDYPWDDKFPNMYSEDNPWPLDVHGRSAEHRNFMNFASETRFRDQLYSHHFFHDPNYLKYDDFFHEIFLSVPDTLLGETRFAYIGHMFKFPYSSWLRPGVDGDGSRESEWRDPGTRRGSIIDNLPIYRIIGRRRFGESEWNIHVKFITIADLWGFADRRVWRQKIWDYVMNKGRTGGNRVPLPPIAPTEEPYPRPAMRPRYIDRRKFACGSEFYLPCYSYIQDRVPEEMTNHRAALWYDWMLAKHERAVRYFDTTAPWRSPIVEGITEKVKITEAEHRNKDDGTMPECSICQSEYTPSQEAARIKTCSHLFHTECLASWLILGDHCPMDRRSYRETLHPDNGVDDTQEFPPAIEQPF